MSDVDALAIASIVMPDEEEIRADERRKFAKWLENNNFCFVEWKPKEKYSVNRSIETVLAMYEKEQK